MVEVTLFHYREGKTLLHRTHALVKLAAVLALSTLLANAALPRLVAMGTLFALLAWQVRLPLRRQARQLRFFLLMGALIAIARLWVTAQPREALVALLRFETLVAMGMLLADTTVVEELARGIGALLAKIPGVPGHRVGATLELTLATIPLLFDIAAQGALARKARLESPWRHPLRRIVSYATMELAMLLERAEDLDMALRARKEQPNQAIACSRLTKVEARFMPAALIVVVGFTWLP